MPDLRLSVQGSAKEPYVVTANGCGPDLRITCSCPAGRLGQTMCKHVAALLVGDVSSLLSPVSTVTDLAALAEGSDWKNRALAHRPGQHGARRGDPDFIETGVFAEDVAPAAREAERRGWVCEIRVTGLYCYGLTPTGRRARVARCWIELNSGNAPHAPWVVRTDGPQGTQRSVKHLSYAVDVFLKTLEDLREGVQ